jgi:hypothetical protein
MDTSNEFGVPAPSYQRSTTSAETTNTRQSATCRHAGTHLPHGATFRTGPNILSPPQEHEDWSDDRYTSPPQYDHSYGISVPTSLSRNHPPTPPTYEDKFDRYSAWNVQQTLQRDETTRAAHHSYGSVASLPRSRGSIVGGQWQANPHVAALRLRQTQSRNTGTVQYHGLPCHTPSMQLLQGGGQGTQANIVQTRTNLGQRDAQRLSHKVRAMFWDIVPRQLTTADILFTSVQ